MLRLLVALYFSAATSQPDYDKEYRDETWLVENVYEGQTAVPLDLVIRLTVGYRDFANPPTSRIDNEVRSLAEIAFDTVRLTVSNRDIPVKLEIKIYDAYALLKPIKLDKDTAYSLYLTNLRNYLAVARKVPEEVSFSTAAGPRVTGLWRNEDTLIISFSEPMDSTYLSINQKSVDIIWEKEDELHSIASDLNLADFVWKTEGELFLISPYSVLEERWTKEAHDTLGISSALGIEGVLRVQGHWIKIARDVRGKSGILLDGNENGIAGENDDAFVARIAGSFPICYSRKDIPDPCVSGDEIDYDF
jgi:hypothetical protein